MNWQAYLLLIAWVSWIGLHSWLGRKRHLRILSVLMVGHLLAFAGLLLWLPSGPDHGGAKALMLMGGAFALLVPVAVGAFSIWKHRARNS